MLFGAFLGPIGAILIFNSIIFVIVAHIAIKHRKRKFTLICRLIGVTYLFGLTWVFGFLTIRSETSQAFQILFVIFNAFQGLFLFLFFCVLSNEARKSWKRVFQGFRSPHPVSNSKASKPQSSSSTKRSTAETSQNAPSMRRSNDLRFSPSEGSDQISTGSEVVEIYFTDENPVTESSARDTSLESEVNGTTVTVIENHYADFNDQPSSHTEMATVDNHEQGSPGQLFHTQS